MRKTNKTTSLMLDAPWHDRLTQVLMLMGETYNALELPPGELEQLRIAFEASKRQGSPDLHQRHIDAALYSVCKEKLTELKVDMSVEETDEHVRKLYNARIEELRSHCDMLIATSAGDTQRFLSENSFVYGRPDKTISAAVCVWVREEAFRVRESASTDLKYLCDEVLRLVPELEGNSSILVPELEVFEEVKALHYASGGYIDLLFHPSGLPKDDFIDQDAGDSICKQAIHNVGSDFSFGYAENGIWSNAPSQKAILRPPTYRLDRSAFIGVICHEIGSHLIEAVNGSRQPLRLLSSGLDRFENGNEGKAYLREQIAFEKSTDFMQHPSWEHVISMHLGVSLALGLSSGTPDLPRNFASPGSAKGDVQAVLSDGKEDQLTLTPEKLIDGSSVDSEIAGLLLKPNAYTFSQIYEVLYALFAFWRKRRYPNEPKNMHEASAHSITWHHVTRILKGTDGKGGSAYLKDIVYLEGNIRCWQLAKESPEMIMLSDLGKFDLTNPRHTTTLKALDILE